MFSKSFALLLVAAIAFSAEAFAPSRPSHNFISSRTALQAVVDIDSEAAFDQTIKNAGSSLVVVDYSTTWCGPCKVIAPKFEELSEKYTDAVFLKVRTCTALCSTCDSPLCLHIKEGMSVSYHFLRKSSVLICSALFVFIIIIIRLLEMPPQKHLNLWSGKVYDRFLRFIISWAEKK